MVSLRYAFSFAAILFSSVAAHGGVVSVSSNGKSFNIDSVGRGQRQNPLPRTAGTKLICNTGTKSSTKSSMSVNPGQSVTFDWRTWTDAHHPGYIETFLAECPGSCNGFAATGKVWFKIHETGLLKRTGGQFGAGVWATDDLVKKQGKKLSVQLPAGLKKGNYILRQNIVAMHLSGNPEFYPNCVHITVGGSGTGVPSASDLVAIPAYLQTNDAKKALDVNIFTKPATYTIAGPRPVKLSGAKAAAVPGQETPAPSESDDDAVTEAPATKPEDDDRTECSDPEAPEAPEADVNPPASSCKTKKGKGSFCPKQTKRSNGTDYERDSSDALASGVKIARRALHSKRRLAEQH